MASLGGVGFLRPAPGSWASALTALAAWPCAGLGPIAWFGVGVLLLLVGLWAAAHVIDEQDGSADPSWVVIDEVAGMWFALLLAPHTLEGWLLALALFRWLDICKPWLVGWAERHFRGAGGVMADDLVAGMLAAPGVPLLLTSAAWLA